MVIIGSDHAGYTLKKKIKEYLKNRNVEYLDVSGENENTKDDYPDIAEAVCKKVLSENENIGIAICGTGIGISISCNKIKGIRAALCHDEYTAKMARMHNNANILCLGEKINLEETTVKNIIDEFLSNKFDGGRHESRIKKIANLEERFGK